MSLIPLQLRYQFDPSGDDVANLVTGETHEIPPINRRIIVPRMGAFYARSMRIRNQQRDLVLGVDYHLAGFFQDATIATGQDVNVMIYFEAGIQGEVTLTYQVVGGMYTGIFETIQDYVNALLVDPRKVKWDDILNKPELYVPMEHFHDINDVYGLNYLIPKLEEIRLAIMRVRSKEMRKIYDRILRIRNDVDKVVAQANQQLGENRTLTAGLQAEINLLKSNLTTLNTELIALKNDQTTANKIRELERDINQLKANDNTFDNQLTDVINRIEAFNNKVPDYDAMVRKFNTLINKTTGKLSGDAYNIGTDKNNILTVDNNGVLRAIPHRYKGVSERVVGLTESFYVDAVNGNDNNVGYSKTHPFRSVEKALMSVKAGTTAIIHLLEEQTHVLLPYNRAVIVDSSITFKSYSKTNKLENDISRAILQCGNNQPVQFFANEYTNVCFNTRGNNSFAFDNINIRVNTNRSVSNGNIINPEERGVFTAKSDEDSLHIRINNRCKIEFGLYDGSHLISEVKSCNSIVLDIHIALFETANMITGDGFILCKPTNKYTIYFDGVSTINNRNTTDTLFNEKVYTPTNSDVIARIVKYLPQLKRTFSSIHGGISANINPAVLPWKTNILSKEQGNLLSVMPDGGLYYGIAPPADIKNIYVDAERGNDTTGDGTKAKPFRTIKMAVEFTDSVAVRTIYLYEGQNHVIDQVIYIKSYGLTFLPYGPVYDKIPNTAMLARNYTLEAYNLNTRITFISPHRHRNDHNRIEVYCIMNRSGAATQLNFYATNFIIEKHPEDDLFGTPSEYNPSLKYVAQYNYGIFYHGGSPINMYYTNGSISFPESAKQKIPLYSGEVSTWGGFTATLRLRSLTGIGPLVHAGREGIKLDIGVSSIGQPELNINTLIPDYATFSRYFPNVYLDTSGNTYPSYIVNIPTRVIPIEKNGYISSKLNFYAGNREDRTESSPNIKKATLTYGTNERFVFSKPLVNSDNQLLTVSPDTGNKLVAKSNGLYVEPSNEVTVSPDNGNIISMRNNGLYATIPQTSGLDFNALNDLPEKTWAKGTSFLAKDSKGNWHRVISPEDLFQDIGVTLTADKYSTNFEVGTDTHVDFTIKCTVTNSQVAKNAMTELTLVLPQHSAESPYEVLDFNHTLKNGDRVERVSDTLYRIYGLQKGGTCILTFKLRVRNFGSYQIGAQVSVESNVDTNSSSNNTSNLTVVAVRSTRLVEQPKEDVNYVTSVDCPMIIASNADTGERYMMMTTTGDVLSRAMNMLRVNDLPAIDPNFAYDIVNNNHTYSSLSKGTLRLKLENCSSYVIKSYSTNLNSSVSSVYIMKNNDGNIVGYKNIFGFINSDESVDIRANNNISMFSNDTLVKSWDHTTRTLSIEYTVNTTYIEIYCRPNGSNCRWQCLAFGRYVPVIYGNLDNDHITIKGITSNNYTIVESHSFRHPTSLLYQTYVNNKYLVYYTTSYTDSVYSGSLPNNIPLVYQSSGIITPRYNVFIGNLHSTLIPDVKRKITLNLNKNTEYNIEILSGVNSGMVIDAIPPRLGNINVSTDINKRSIKITTTSSVSESDNILSEYLDIFFT